ncbi:glycosyl transferase group 1 [Methylophaga lonarensis MPL]|uniref:Glycosyl transferase group 1 n=1 Tax=Methylophaga lonarensis MPL TaxID=1286106 RepID=M7PV85_9GAMM|nr:glycosyltransferase family 4 protein [Methylophaga lonarensis]EMR14354.1 glycosyl transferase group 1 [Methylophaga lonarensis MPL]
MDKNTPLRILALRPSYINNYGIGYAATQLAKFMNKEGEVISHIMSIDSVYAKEGNYVKTLLPRFLNRLATKLFSEQSLKKFTERRFIRMMKHYDVAHLWPGISVDTVQRVKFMGKVIVMECVNCHQSVAKSILDTESQRLGGVVTNTISQDDIKFENELLEAADFVFGTSPEVINSLLSQGVKTNKIINTSYGLSDEDIHPPSMKKPKAADDLVAIFVGSVIARKGIHLLLDYWLSANVPGKLKVIGRIAASDRPLVSAYFDKPSIEFIEFTNELHSHYANADVFLLPSLEEGSPLVTYLALGASLPCIVSSMGAGGVIEDDVEGFVINPHHKEQWISAIRQLFTDSSLREKFSRNTGDKAEYYRWQLVASRRADALLRACRSK